MNDINPNLSIDTQQRFVANDFFSTIDIVSAKKIANKVQRGNAKKANSGQSLPTSTEEERKKEGGGLDLNGRSSGAGEACEDFFNIQTTDLLTELIHP